MAKTECVREAQVLESAATGAMDVELRDHVAGCENCRDLLDVAGAILNDRADLTHAAQLPGSGLMWWRMNLRARREAARSAVRTGSFVQVVLLVAAIVAGLAWLGISIDVHAVFTSLTAAAQRFTIPLIALAAWLILAPVAVYFAVTDK